MSDFTKKALEQSLKKLLKKKPFDEITVSEVVEDCGISRSTFYYQFADLNALVEWSTLHIFSRVLGESRTYETWEDGFKNILHEVYAEKEYVTNVYRFMDKSKIEERLNAWTYTLLRNVVEEQASGMNVSEEKKNFIADFYKYAFVGMVLQWVDEGMTKDPNILIEEMGKLMHGTFRASLHTFEQK